METDVVPEGYPRNLSHKQLEAAVAKLMDEYPTVLTQNTVEGPRRHMDMLQVGLMEQNRRQTRLALIVSTLSLAAAAVAVIISVIVGS